MRRFGRFAGLVLAGWLGLTLTATGQGTPKAPDILDNYLKVTGGKEAHEKIKSQVSTGTMEMGGTGIKGKISALHAMPSKFLIRIEIEGLGTIEQGTDGKVVWEKNPITGDRILMGEEKTAFLRRADIHSDVNWRKHYKKVELAGEEKVNDKAAYKVVMTPDEGEKMTQFFDKESGLLVKIAVTAKTAMGEIPTESFVSDWKKVDGVLVPHKVRQIVLVQEITIVLDKVESNAKIADEKFAIPADIQKLLDKK